MKKTMRTLLALVLAVAQLCGMLSVAAAANDSMETATAITAGETVDVTMDTAYKYAYYAVETTKPGQFIEVDWPSDSASMYVYDAQGSQLDGYWNGNARTYIGGESGTHYIRFYSSSAVSFSFTVTLTDNDAYEPNQTKETAYALTSGETAQIALRGGDQDWFAIETTEAGQDVQIDISGFNYANYGRFYMMFDEFSYQYVGGNRTYYYHADEAGTHYIQLYEGYAKDENDNTLSEPLNVSLTATVLDGDEDERGGNDAQENAVTLNPGTDDSFYIGGWGDEDWFQFEADPQSEEGDLYTLQFRDLNPDYSDKFYYAVYAPDGTVVTPWTLVNIYHSNILSCDQQGMYKVCVSSSNHSGGWNESYVDITRSPLRIRVSVGGADPYEGNDTWLDAKPIQPEQLVQHVLAATTDRDWFYFTADEADMSFSLTLDRFASAYLYRAEDLAEYGADVESFWSTGSSGTRYGKLDGAGVYYLRLSTDTSNTSEELRSLTVALTPHVGEENNDTWDRATPLYEGAPQEFFVAGNNDADWFRLVAPEGAEKLLLTSNLSGTVNCYVYREQDIISNGIDTNPIYDGYLSSGTIRALAVSPGAYCVKVWNYWYENDLYTGTLQCDFLYGEESTMENAADLEPGIWSEEFSTGRYFRLGTLKAGDVVRYNRDTSYERDDNYNYYAQVSLCSSDGTRANNTNYIYAHYALTIPADGEYYLYVGVPAELNENGELDTCRIRYDVGAGEEYVTEIEGPDAITLTVGQKQYLDLRMAPYTAKSGGGDWPEYYNNSDASVAVYDYRNGRVTAKTPGTTTLKFRGYNGTSSFYKEITVNVVEAVAADGVSISGAPEKLELGHSVRLTAAVSPAGATEGVVWSSSDPSVLYVNPKGKVVAVGEGTADITAGVEAGSASVTIQVTPAELTENEITSIELDHYSMTMYMGEETRQLTAAVLPAGIEAQVEWTSSNPAAAAVDQNGVVTAVAPGISIITAAAGDYTASCIVTVQAARVRVTGISFAESSLQIPLGGQTTLLPTITPSNATTRTLTWVSDDESVVTVSRTGIVNALAVGVTTIRATTLDGGFVAEITMEVTAAPRLGDINGDGYIDSADALITLRVIVGLTTLTEEQEAAADVNKDGWVDAGDAVKILRYDARLIDSLE